ncbi:MAG TPA: methylglyoxal synthase [Beijerinckiaceae bacterium]|nr:methylglyoxal synthase [Rhodoblastus sp.]MCB9998952.1 methylglyoxal synthase [Methylobacteriaceae bacterium]MCC2100186.1 methylglyoxal synthase [Hyphomicrobiales bacterium]HRY04360.1 methylglyoxal synthase [Beijerinckiaceae bacterium]MCB1524244.1 methylglyoxal synthase [Rhodoblastus sp.]
MMPSIALVAHDLKKEALAAWAKRNERALARCALVSTGTTGAVVMETCPSLDIRRMKSGPLGGDQQIGALIAEGAIDALIFFPDPLTPMPHDVDVKALLRLTLVYDIPCAFNPRTADMLVAGGLLDG